jgi:hypothetical protein
MGKKKPKISLKTANNATGDLVCCIMEHTFSNFVVTEYRIYGCDICSH